jgi:hypothetical protein
MLLLLPFLLLAGPGTPLKRSFLESTRLCLPVAVIDSVTMSFGRDGMLR